MGQKGSSVQPDLKIRPEVPSFAHPWGLIHTDTVENWNKISRAYGFGDHLYGCMDRECDRDSVCLAHARAALKKHKHLFEVIRYKKTPKTVSYAGHLELKAKVSSGFQLTEVVAAMKDDLVLLILYRWESLQYEAVFVFIDLHNGQVLGFFDSPMPNMSIMECRIGPDASCVAVLFYFRSKTPFRYDIYLFSTETFKVIDIVHCNTEVRPYMTFDPRYKSTRLAVVNYTKASEGLKNGLVLYCVRSHKIIATSHVMLSIIYGGGYFCVNYSKDGNYLILQKISDNMNGIHCYADSYVFDSNNLKLLKHYFANLQGFSTLCGTNYAPLFSWCGSRMCITSEEQAGDKKRLLVSVYQLPRPLRLQDQCRIVILQNLRMVESIIKLPLPHKLKEFLQFKPERLN